MSDDLTRIRIMADYGGAYAWDQHGVSIGLGYNFEHIPEIKLIEENLLGWSGEFSKAENDDPRFPWDDLHKRGIALTSWLNDTIPPDINIEICYQRPYEDPLGKMLDEPIIFRKRK